jgi:hypothetical protein
MLIPGSVYLLSAFGGREKWLWICPFHPSGLTPLGPEIYILPGGKFEVSGIGTFPTLRAAMKAALEDERSDRVTLNEHFVDTFEPLPVWEFNLNAALKAARKLLKR